MAVTASAADFVFSRNAGIEASFAVHNLTRVGHTEVVQGNPFVMLVETIDMMREEYSENKVLGSNLATPFYRRARVPDLRYFHIVVGHTDQIVHTAIADSKWFFHMVM